MTQIKHKSANNLPACLIYCGDGQYRIRIYAQNATDFCDYDIKHSDLWFEIQDEDAYLYTDGTKKWIDHSPATLGIADETSVG